MSEKKIYTEKTQQYQASQSRKQEEFLTRFSELMTQALKEWKGTHILKEKGG